MRMSRYAAAPLDPRRRRVLTGALALSGAAALGRAPAILAQSRAPLKIGVLNSFSKVFAALGNANLQAMTMYIEANGGMLIEEFVKPAGYGGGIELRYRIVL